MQQAVATVRGLAMLDTLHPDGERNRQQWSSVAPGSPSCLAGCAGPVSAASATELRGCGGVRARAVLVRLAAGA